MIESSSLLSLAKAGFNKISIACGNFDGLHIGHQQIIKKLIEVSIENNSQPVVLTFHPHPREVLTGTKVQNLTSTSIKKRLLKDMGVSALVTIPFTKEFAAHNATSFVEKFLLSNELTICDLCVGNSWKFGKDRSGDVDFLSSDNWPFQVHPVPEVSDHNGVISSSRIRKTLNRGDFHLAEKLLGRPYAICGPVIKGKGVALSQLNFPTANIHIADIYLPLAGVYICEVSINNDKNVLPAICNIGFAPTFGGDDASPASLEVHLLNFSEDLYGKVLEVTFVSFLRKEQKFANLDQLKQQIERDAIAAKKHFSIP